MSLGVPCVLQPELPEGGPPLLNTPQLDAFPFDSISAALACRACPISRGCQHIDARLGDCPEVRAAE